MDEAQVLAQKIASRLPPPVELIETIAAIVILSGERAYKIKRPVRFSFLDFSTPGARHAALAHELELNARTAPEIYRRLVPVAADGEIEAALPVEWALEMNRFDNAMRLDSMLQQGRIGDAMLDDLAGRIASFHQTLQPLETPLQVEAMARIVQGNEGDIEASVGAVFDPEQAWLLHTTTRQALESVRDSLSARQGWVRHCHGDLHSENIVCIDGKLVLFDCIEFNDDFARIDCLYDIAFLVMDMCERGHQSAAWRVFNTYLDHLPQDDGLRLWPLFLSVRAAIRAKVEGFARHDDKARRYLNFAHQVLVEKPPLLLAIGGLSGTGKSTIARAIAPTLGRTPGALHLRSDIERKRLFETSFESRLPERAYAPEVSETVLVRLCERASQALAGGQSVIIDMVCAKPQQRQKLKQLGLDLGVDFKGVWLEAPLVQRQQRIDDRRHDVSDADRRVASIQERYDSGEIDWHRIDATRPVASIVDEISERLRSGF